ncbi:DUF1631 domain-containing protein [Curvibacter sp. CHRR-16]|uniref:DUF1631 family protein n=1 Tax=Curvibacter sp. CHRR-16 TaxID=2835872 RepID=UPI001BDB5ABA|nr:DUF1631 family protein [Curvibacter sp. CHRR-16]MBT0570435.1 DUF1631 domain-containing protein [Curvibacter sp. CHRR-16]
MTSAGPSLGTQRSTPQQSLARAVREAFLVELGLMASDMCQKVDEYFTGLISEAVNTKEAQARRDAWGLFKQNRQKWLDLMRSAWRESLHPPKVAAVDAFNIVGLSLVSEDEVENKILAARVVQAVSDKVQSEYDDVRVRIRVLESREELAEHDLFRPEVVINKLVEQWTEAGMSAEGWAYAVAIVERVLIVGLFKAYQQANQSLIDKGVMERIELKDRMRSIRMTPSARSSSMASLQSDSTYGAAGASSSMGAMGSGFGQVGATSTGVGHQDPSARYFGARAQAMGAAPVTAPSSPMSMGDDVVATAQATMSPLAKARVRAQGIVGQIRRLLVSHVGTEEIVSAAAQAGGQAVIPSVALADALTPGRPGNSRFAPGGTLYLDYSPAGVQRVAEDLRQRSEELKEKAETKSEKAIVEIVALMFQAILAEDRIPPGVRVWFARLQMPVLRTALTDADFLSTTDHPARLLIDRMGSVVMGFDSASVQGTALEAEIRRIVQVVEQYPETGKKVYQIVFTEFQKFLEKFLTEKGEAKKVIGVAQQVEQKETLTIQYTIEMRNLLKDLPVRDGLRDFFFKVWAEVLAVAALRKGPQHADTIVLKKTAADLVWAASAKPSRADRAKVIQELPKLLQRLRSGMTLLGLPPSEQEQQIKLINETLADAFMSKTQTIDQARIDAMAARLSNLEDFISDDGMGDLPLDAESIEMMLGVDASEIEVVTDGGTKPTAAMQAWAFELQLGTWFTLDHNGRVTQVQLVWRSAKKHLNLFAAVSGKSYLVQNGRLASYLQAGLLLPQEDEALTVRATRDALTKLQANPERLLA